MRPDSPTPDPAWVVLKFGGTSVASPARWQRIAEQVRARLDEGLRPVVVCSAVAGISDALDALGPAALKGDADPLLERIVNRHRDHAGALNVEQSVVDDLLDGLGRLARGITLVGEISPRVVARIMAHGELLSTRIGAAFLANEGIDVQWVDARECISSLPDPTGDVHRAFLNAECGHDADAALSARLAEGPAVVLTQGFIAADTDGHTVLLGRGGSDTAAALFAARLGARRCEIWTDVPGMFTADPRGLPDARLIERLDYDEAQEIASTGAKVLHPRCIAPVRAHGIPLHIRWTERPETPGTTVGVRVDDEPRVRAISTRKNQWLVSMDTPGMWQQVGFLADVFAVFKAHGISVDLVSTSEMNVTVSVDPAANPWDAERAAALEAALSAHCQVGIIGPCAVISLVGRRIRAILHRLGPALAVFEEQQVHLLSQAASDLNLSVVVDEAQAERLVRNLHSLLFQEAARDPSFGPTWLVLNEQQARPVDSAGQTPWWHDERDRLLEIAAERTPIYAYHGPTIDAAADRLMGLESVDRVFYAVKANSHLKIIQRLARAGLGFECVSPQELDHVRFCVPRLPPDRLLFTPNFAPKREYIAGFRHKAWVTLDNLHPLEAWPEVFAGRKILVRIDPGQGRGHHDHVKTAGARSKFGVSFGQLDRLAELAAAHDVEIVGLHAHSGSGIRTADQWAEVAERLAEAAARFPTVKHLDVGGGLAVAEKPGKAGVDLAAVDETLAAFKAKHPQYALWIEPGRYLVADAGVILAEVTQLKRKGPVRYVGVDVGMNTLIRPALYGAYHGIVNLSRLGEAPQLVANVVGPICESGDTLGYNRHLPKTAEGDTMLVATAGAYGRSMASNYNLRPPAREVIID